MYPLTVFIVSCFYFFFFFLLFSYMLILFRLNAKTIVSDIKKLLLFLLLLISCVVQKMTENENDRKSGRRANNKNRNFFRIKMPHWNATHFIINLYKEPLYVQAKHFIYNWKQFNSEKCLYKCSLRALCRVMAILNRRYHFQKSKFFIYFLFFFIFSQQTQNVIRNWIIS